MSQSYLHPILALTTGQWTVLGVTSATIVAILWVARSRARASADGDGALGAGVEASAQGADDVDAIEAEVQRRADPNTRRVIQRGVAPDLSGGPSLSRGPDLSDGPSLGR